MEIKVECPCGQGYAFEVEPVNGAMPCAINCPSCNADGTQLANQFISQSTAATTASEPAPIAGLRINRPAVQPPPLSVPQESPTIPEPAAPSKRFYTRSLEPEKAPPPGTENIPMGILGGLITGSIAMMIWYGLTVATGRHYGIVAWLVGVVAGFGVRVLGRDETPALGFIAAVCACLAIFGGDFLATGHYLDVALHQNDNALINSIYEKEMVKAKEAVNLKTDSEIRNWLQAKHEVKDVATQKDVDEFRTYSQPKWQDIVDGKTPRAEIEKKIVTQFSTYKMRFRVFQSTMTLFTILWLGFGIASAYRIASG